jgi:hypothetical protein
LLEIARKSDGTLKPATDTSTANSRKLPALQRHVDGNGTGSRNQKQEQPADVTKVRYQTKVPVITGEAHYRGTIPVDGILLGQLGHNGGSLAVRQKTQHGASPSGPELTGEITFRDMVRVNGHIAGTVYSQNGTLIVGSGAAVDANVEVAIALIKGTVKGDIVARQRIEIGRGATVLGNIWTRSISVEPGATFDGICTMIEDR